MRLLFGLLLSGLAAFALADGPPSSGGPYALERFTVDAGGGESIGGGFVLRGTSGQHDAADASVGGAFDLEGGFWPGTNNPNSTVFRDSLESGVAP